MPRKLLEWRTKLFCASEHNRRLSAHLDGELAGSARAGVEAHLAVCPTCRAEYEQLRFASRALSHFAVPEVRQPVWQVDTPLWQRHSGSPLASWLKRFCATKIAVPTPVFAAGLFAAIIMAALLLTRPVGQTQTLGASPPASVPTVATKIIEVPVEREVVRERVVTRIVYARQSRSPQRNQARLMADAPRPAAALAGRMVATDRDQLNSDGQIFVRANVEGFRPVTNANLRIVKEPQQ